MQFNFFGSPKFLQVHIFQKIRQFIYYGLNKTIKFKKQGRDIGSTALSYGKVFRAVFQVIF